MTNDGMVEYLMGNGGLKSKVIINAFRKVDRRDFVLDQDKNSDYVYGDAPLPIGYEQTISQPYTVAFMLELLQPKIGNDVLDIGSGSGWTTGLLTQIIGEKGSVLGLERISELVEFGNNNLFKYNFANAKIVNSSDFKFDKEKYNKILVSASAQKLPQKYLNALKPNGTLVIPVQNSIFKISKNKLGKISETEYPGFVFVPLID